MHLSFDDLAADVACFECVTSKCKLISICCLYSLECDTILYNFANFMYGKDPMYGVGAWKAGQANGAWKSGQANEC